MKIICIDPGHGGDDPGAVNGEYKESDIVLDIAKNARNILELENNFAVLLTRSHDWQPEFSRRVGLANQLEADIFVSIHVNSFSGPHANGIETFCFPGSSSGRKLANNIQKILIENLQRNDRGVKENRKFHVLRKTSMPAILTEIGFLSNATEKKLLSEKEFRFLAAESIATGIEKYFEKEI